VRTIGKRSQETIMFEDSALTDRESESTAADAAGAKVR